MNAPDADIIVIGSGPAGGVAALRAAEAGYSVLVLEAGKQAPAGPWFTFDRTRATLAYGGLFTPTFPSTLGLGVPAAVGGGFAANSGFYRWVSNDTMRSWSQVCPTDQLLAARAWVESHLEIDRSAPRDRSAALLAATAHRMGMDPVDVPFWLHAQFDPRGPFLAAALESGVVLQTGITALSITKSASHRVVHLADGSTRSGRMVLLAAGAFGSFQIAAASGFVSPRTTANGHVMMKSVLFPVSETALTHHDDNGVIGRVQASHSADLLSGCALASPWSLAANHPEHYDEILSALDSTSRPVSWYTQLTVPAAISLRAGRALHISQLFKKSSPDLRRLAEAHFSLCESTGHPWRFAGTWSTPTRSEQLLRSPRCSMVHITSTLPLGTVLDEFGRFPADNAVACCDVSTLPTAPGVNPQAALLALAKRNVDGFLSTALGGIQ